MRLRFACLPAAFAIVAALAMASAAIAAPGDLDRTFSRDGRVTVGVPGWHLARGSWGELARGSNGRIALAGALQSDASLWKNDPLVAVFRADGRRDRQFAGDGRKVIHDPGDTGEVSVAVQPGGAVLVAVVHRSEARVVRFRPNGRVDGSFGSDGAAHVPAMNVHDMAIDGAGRVLLAGSVWTEDRDRDFAAFRLTPGGRPDPRFGARGLVTVDFHRPEEPNPSRDHAEALALRSDGGIVLCGGSETWGDTQRDGVVLAALTADGSLEPSFGDGGRVFAGPDAGVSFSGDETAGGMSVASGPRDAVVFGGIVHEDFTASVYTAFGHPDGLFAGGTVVVDGGGRDDSDAIAATPDGSVYMAGSVAGPESTDFAVLRLMPYGERDYGFGDRGVATVDFGGLYDDADGMVVRPDASILVSGTVGNDRLGLMALQGR